MYLWQKICFYCGSNLTIKRGHLKGSQQWYRKTCGRTFVWRYLLKEEAINALYAKGNLTVKNLAEGCGVSTRIVYWNLTMTYMVFLPDKPARSVVVLMDTTYGVGGRNFGVFIIKDSLKGDILWYKFIKRHERLEDYRERITCFGQITMSHREEIFYSNLSRME